MALFNWLVALSVVSLSWAYPTCVVDVTKRVACGKQIVSQENATILRNGGRGSETITIYGADSCLAAGCCWMRSHDTAHASTDCYAPVESVHRGYELIDFEATTSGYKGHLKLIGEGVLTFGKDLPSLLLTISFHSGDIIEVKIKDNEEERWEIPESVIPRHSPWILPPNKHESLSHVAVSYTKYPFTLQLTRKSDGEVIFSLDEAFFFKDQYLEFSLLSSNQLQSRNTFGFGESTRLHQALKVPSLLTLWAADVPAMIMSENLYGSYPFYLQQITDPASPNLGKAHGGLFLNSNGMDVAILPDRITVRAIGGIFDLFVFAGDTAKAVVSQSTEIIGKPMMVPYWSLGFHNCRWGYTSIEEVEEIVANYSKAKIPLDTQWFDIDYMDGYRDFTVNASTFPKEKVKAFVDSLHSNGQHFVPILDPGVKVDLSGNYDSYNEGLALDLFIKDPTGTNYYNGQVWPGVTNFPDFFHPSTQDYWTRQFTSLYEMIEPDGIWIDMNEISNFCNKEGVGQVCVNDHPETCQEMTTSCCLTCLTVDETNPLDFPPYHINNLYGRLGARTIAMSSRLSGGDKNVTVYDSHNLYGLLEQIASNIAMTTVRGGKHRPFVLSRSSFISTGRVSAKWTGDNVATWNALRSSIVSLLDFNLFSVPMIGADICGFYQDTNEELCARWIEVGAFYPFSRDHNANHWLPQELYRWETVAEAGRRALAMRYQLLPYYYSLFYQSHSEGLPVIQSLWMNYPRDLNCSLIDEQFMIGDALLVSPVLHRGHRQVLAYFPGQELWYDFAKRQLAFDQTTSGGSSHSLFTPLEEVNLHLRGGRILPLQQPAMTTTEGRKTPFTYLVAFSGEGEAEGSLFWDDGEQVSLDQIVSLSFRASLSHKTFTATVKKNTWSEASNYKVGSVVMMSRDMARPVKVLVDEEVLTEGEEWSFDILRRSLTLDLSERNLSLAKSFSVKWF